MCIECLQCFFGFVSMPLEEEEEFLVIKKLSIVVDLVFCYILMKFIYFFAFVFVMLNLSEVEEAGSFLSLFSLLFLLWVIN